MIARLRKLKSRGQAMLEYSAISFLLFVTTAGVGWPFIAQLLHGLSKYYEGIYFVLTSPVP